MKVVAVVPLYPPAHRVGAWLSTHECLLELVRRGHDVQVIRELAGRTDPFTYDGIEVVTGGHHVPRLVPDADLVVSHVGDTGRAHKAALSAGVPSVRMAHGGPTEGKLDGAALVVWNSATYCGTEPAWLGRQIVVYPPVHAADHATTPGDMVTIVNLSKAKGVTTFWKAAEQLPDLTFLGVRGVIGEQVKPRARNVEIVPPTDDMRTVWSRTKVLLVPSEVETWGRVGVEAFASGIPVIAHPTPGLRESLGNAGIFVDRDDVGGWVSMIRKLTERPTSWEVASKMALQRSRRLDPTKDLERFAQHVESLVPVAV